MFNQGGCSVSVLLSELMAPRLLLGTVLLVLSALVSGEAKRETLFLCNKKKSKKQMFHVKMCACFSQSHVLSFFQATVPCTVSAAVGRGWERLNHLEVKNKIFLGWAFPI